MRKLTLDEKISLKGIFNFKGLTLPQLNTEIALFFWKMCCYGTIAKWHLYKNHKKNHNKA